MSLIAFHTKILTFYLPLHGDDYIFFSVGAVAQLEERVVRNDKVVGSIPIGSTNSL